MFGRVRYMDDGVELEYAHVLIQETFGKAYEELLDNFFESVPFTKIRSIEIKAWEACESHERETIANEYSRQRQYEHVEMEVVMARQRSANTQNNPCGLTDKEVQVTKLFVCGYGAKEICGKLETTENTINNLLTVIRHKLGAYDRLDLVRRAIIEKVATIEEFLGGKHD